MLRQPVARPAIRALARPTRIPRRAFLAPRSRGGSSRGRPIENLNLNRLSQESEDYHRNRRIFLISGAVAGVVSFIYTAYRLQQELSKPTKLDTSLPPTDPLAGGDAAGRKVVVHDEDGNEIVPTGHSTVPTFPRTIELPSYTSEPSNSPPASPSLPSGGLATTITRADKTEYTLVGLGVRSVSFIGIHVYVVGYYIATADIAALQNALVKKVNPIATTLVPGERDQLRAALLDPAEGEATWEELLGRGIPARSVFRVVPVRDTDFHHLRDGFVRSIQGRSGAVAGQDAGNSFGESMAKFRALFNRGSVPKRKELLLIRDGQGKLSIVYDDGKRSGRQLLGTVDDERISHALWLHYLAGKKVASEPARQSIVEGVMEFVERPVGTVAAQVV